MALSKQVEDALKRTKRVTQRVKILHSALQTFHKVRKCNYRGQKATEYILKNPKRLKKQQDPFIESMLKTSIICDDIALDRKKPCSCH